MSRPIQTWQFFIHAQQRYYVDLNLKMQLHNSLRYRYNSIENSRKLLLVIVQLIITYLRVDISATEGQTLKQSLILRGTPVSRLVKCYSSHPSELLVRFYLH